MRTLRVAPCLLLPLLLALGCRTNPNQVLLERDLRLQEDKIYQLQGMLEDACSARESTIRENEALKKELSQSTGPAGTSMQPPAVDMPGAPSIKPPEMPKFEAPQIELPATPETLPKETGPTNDEAAVDGSPTKIVFNKRLTGGLDRDGQPGDEGILVAVEPRDDAGRLIKAPGAVSIVLLDPAEQGEQARVARWNYRADEIPGHFHNTPFGHGLQFELPWPGEPPKNRDLQLFVRFTTIEGQKITADTKIDVRPALAGAGRAPNTWAASQNARRTPPRTSVPTHPSASKPARDLPSDDAEPSNAPRSDSRADDSLDQATRSNRPVWKPYR